MPSSMIVETKSAWASKINWTQAVSLVATILAVKGVNLDPDTQIAVVMTIQGIQAIVTWVFRTWFTTTVTPSSAG